MAVPTLNLDTVAAFRPSYQDYLSRSRQNEHENRARWEEASKYFQNNQIRCTKNNQWGSENSFHQSLESFASEHYEEINKVCLKWSNETVLIARICCSYYFIFIYRIESVYGVSF